MDASEVQPPTQRRAYDSPQPPPPQLYREATEQEKTEHANYGVHEITHVHGILTRTETTEPQFYREATEREINEHYSLNIPGKPEIHHIWGIPVDPPSAAPIPTTNVLNLRVPTDEEIRSVIEVLRECAVTAELAAQRISEAMSEFAIHAENLGSELRKSRNRRDYQ